MFPTGTIARWLAAMIVMIVANAVPSAAHAHAGHDHGARHATHHAAQVVASATMADGASLAYADERAGDAQGICPCCAATCCAPAILSGPIILSEPGRMHAVLRPADARTVPGRSPDSPIEPPRSLA